jgi:hypothetical protein
LRRAGGHGVGYRYGVTIDRNQTKPALKISFDGIAKLCKNCSGCFTR